MTTQYTSILKLALPVQGELSGTWGDVVNDNITSMVEEAVAGRAVINSWTTNSHVLTTADGTTSESRCAMLEFTDTGAALTGAATVVCPSASKLYVCKNDTGQQVTVKTAAGTGVAIPDGQTMFVFCDGTNVEQCETNFNSLSYNGYTLNFGGAVTTGGAFTTSGAYAVTLTATGATNVTLPTTGTLATLDGTETLTNKTLTGPTISSPTLTGSISATDVTITGDTTIGDANTDSLTVNATLNSGLVFLDDTYDIGASGATRPRNLYLSGNATIGGTVTLSGGIDVTGALGVDGDFDVNTDKFTVASATGNTLVAGTLGVTGAITATGGLKSDEINEVTATAGVTVDGVLLKDTAVGTADASGTDVAGTQVTIRGGAGTGTGAGGSIVFQTAPAGTTGSSVNAQVTAMSLTSSGNAVFNNEVSIGGKTTITVSSDIDALTVISTAAAGNTAPDIKLFNQSASPADNDNLGQVLFLGYDDAVAPNTVAYGTMFVTSTDVSEGTADGRISWGVASGGTQAGNNLVMTLDNAGLNVTGVVVDDGATHDGDVTFTGASYNAVWDKSENSLVFSDSAKARFGAGTDLQIHSDGTNGFITGAVGNKIYIKAAETRLTNQTGNEYVAQFVENGAVTLYYDNEERFQTTSAGINVTGQTLTDSLTVTGDTTLNDNDAEILTLQRDGGTDANTAIHFDQDTYATYVGTDENGHFVVGNSLNLMGDARLRITQGGDVNFYTGPANPDVLGSYWDASESAWYLKDNVELRFGNDANFFIKHDGTNNLIDAGTNTMLIQGATITLEDTSGNDFLSVTSGSTTITTRAKVTGASPDYLLMENDSTNLNTRMVNAEGIFEISTLSDDALSQTKRMTIDHSTGDIKFKESNGTDDYMVYDAGSGIVFNEAGNARNFRIETDTYSNTFYVDGANDRVGILTSSPAYRLDVNGELNAQEYHNAEVRSNYAPALNFDFVNSESIDPLLYNSRSSSATYYDDVTQHRSSENLCLTPSYPNVNNTNQVNITNGFYNRGTATNNAVTAPDNTTTATSYVEDDTLGTHDVYQFSSGLSIGNTYYTGSVFIKSSDKTYMTVSLASSATNWISVTVNLSTGAVVSNSDTGNATYTSSNIRAYPNGWYRVEVTGLFTNTVTYLLVGGATSSTPTHTTYGREEYTGNGTDTYYTWGWQLERGESATSYNYASASTGNMQRFKATMKTAGASVPRIDYDPITRECKGALIEELRTNAFVQSSNFANGAWTKTNMSIETDVAWAPDGTLTADRMIPTATSNCYINDDTAVDAGTYYTHSVFVKAAGMRYFQLAPSTGFGSVYQNFDLENGVLASGDAGGYASMRAVGDGWYRCAVSLPAGTTGQGRMLMTCNNADDARLTAAAADSYRGVLIWGAQFETGSWPSSYIATAGSTASRQVDQLYVPTGNLEGWGEYNVQEGTFFVDFLADPHRGAIVDTFSGGLGIGSTTYLGVGYDSGSQGYFQPTHGSLPSTSTPSGLRLKAALRWTTNWGTDSQTTAQYAANGSVGDAESRGQSNFLQTYTHTTDSVSQGISLDVGCTRFSTSNKKPGWVRAVKYYTSDIGSTALGHLTEID